MNKFLVVPIAILLTLGIYSMIAKPALPQTAKAASPQATVYDNFDDGLFDAKKWQLTMSGSGPTAIEQDGRLVVTLPANSQDDSQTAILGAGYISKCYL